MSVTGICTGYFTCYGSIKIDSDLSWRLPFIMMAVAGTALAVSCFYLPSSPRWLLVHDRRGEALWALERLNIPQAEAEKDILRPVEGGQAKVSMWRAIANIFQRRYRMRTTLGLFVLGMVQLSGIDGVLYVSLANILCFISHNLLLSTLTSSPVCPNSLHASRPLIWHSILPRIRRLSNPHARYFDPCFPLCR